MKKIFLLLLLHNCFGADAINSDSLLAKANMHYINMQYQYAADIYGELLKTETKSFSIYYNSGNAFVKLTQYGKGIWCYRNALLLHPNDYAVLANLNIALQKCNLTYAKPKLNFISVISKMSRFFNANHIAILLLFGTIFLSILYCVSLIIINKKIWKTIFKYCIYLFSIFLVYFLFQTIAQYFVKEAIILTKASVYENINSNVKIEILNEGNTVQLTNKQSKLLATSKRVAIYLETGITGWIDSEHIGLLP